MDDSAGRILGRLEELDRAENPVVFLMSENGGLSIAGLKPARRQVIDAAGSRVPASRIPGGHPG